MYCSLISTLLQKGKNFHWTGIPLEKCNRKHYPCVCHVVKQFLTVWNRTGHCKFHGEIGFTAWFRCFHFMISWFRCFHFGMLVLNGLWWCGKLTRCCSKFSCVVALPTGPRTPPDPMPSIKSATDTAELRVSKCASHLRRLPFLLSTLTIAKFQWVFRKFSKCWVKCKTAWKMNIVFLFHSGMCPWAV